MSEIQLPEESYDEGLVPAYELPELLRFESGGAVASVADWQRRRSELLRLFEAEVYGPIPPPLPFDAEVVESATPVYGGIGLRDQIRLRFKSSVNVPAADDAPFLDLLLVYPATARKSPAPVFVALNFGGNHSSSDDPAIRVTESWVADKYRDPVTGDPAGFRGKQAYRWPFEKALAAGFAVATFCYSDVAPDHPDRWRDGVARLLLSQRSGLPAVGEPGAISLWAWGLSRVLDYLEGRPEIDAAAAIVAGHSRQGKTALWCGATDARFAAAISNCSGCGGAALSRRRFGERFLHINTNFPHWFTARFKAYNEREQECPVDQHQLIALLAPRPVYVASATEDLHADPRGEFLGALAAEPAYALYGLRGLGTTEQPEPDRPAGEFVRYHVRTGRHDIVGWDWLQYIDFARFTVSCRAELRSAAKR